MFGSKTKTQTVDRYYHRDYIIKDRGGRVRSDGGRPGETLCPGCVKPFGVFQEGLNHRCDCGAQTVLTQGILTCTLPAGYSKP
jgi:hypothetical protein